jgi:hypothetical protein
LLQVIQHIDKHVDFMQMMMLATFFEPEQASCFGVFESTCHGCLLLIGMLSGTLQMGLAMLLNACSSSFSTFLGGTL